MGEEATNYDASQIQVLEGWEAIRKRAGMYIGSTGERGLSQLVFEAAGRAVNDVLAGRASHVDITLMPDGGVCLADDGPGDGVDEVGGTGMPGLEALLTRMQTRTWSCSRRDVEMDLCGVGPFVVNALSSRMTAEVRRGGVRWIQEYARGVALTPLTEAGASTGSGTTVTFWPDAEIFGSAELSFEALTGRFRELALLNRGLQVSLTDRRRSGESRAVRFRYPDGVRDFVALLDGREAPVHPQVIGFEQEEPRMAGTVEVALRWCGGAGERVRSFANNRPTDGGTHERGFREGVAAAVTAYARQRQLLSAADAERVAERVGEGLTAVVSVKLDDPEFLGSTCGVLGNTAVRACVGQAVQEHLGGWLEAHPEHAAAVLDRIIGR
ncbi:DNA gyrase subunit B [Streptacidiphilus sp. N1-3]|uniref:DNA topoisomerase (ATP-hydrolyzing) n=1 Tax=Streptacidiphilus alkalitolerans TaxID=3342712 RepID=A0ABV6XDT1_9ACTN